MSLSGRVPVEQSRCAHHATKKPTSPSEPDWRVFAECQDYDPELFFINRASSLAAAQIQQAKAICAKCPVTRDCLDTALEQDMVGIWGGLTELERTRVRLTRPSRTGRRTA